MENQPKTIGDILPDEAKDHYPSSVLNVSLDDARFIVDLYKKHQSSPPGGSGQYWAQTTPRVGENVNYWSGE